VVARPPSPAARRPFGYEPGLDGLRAVAVVLILAFHLEAPWARGGFLGVSVFFTLSGFLITRLLLSEFATRGRISVGRFWGRRLRRLAPASLLCLLGVVLLARWVPPGISPGQLRGDAAAAMLDVANWRAMLSHQSYADLFVGQPSPLLHFWSLAVEEQFYLLFPLVLIGLCVAARRWRPALPVGLGVLTMASVAAMLATGDHDVVYYGTHTRAAELLIGALLGVAVDRFGAPRGRRAEGAVRVASTAALVVLVAVTAGVTESTAWLYAGGLAALGLAWCGLVLGAVTPGPMRTVLSSAPLVVIGQLSYGLYVFHWPVFVFLDTTGFSGPSLVLAKLALTVALAAISFALVERPVRLSAWPPAGRPSQRAFAAALCTVAIAIVALGTAAPAPGGTSTMLAAPIGTAPVMMPSAVTVQPSATTVQPSAPTVAPATTTTIASPPPLTVAVVGSDEATAVRVAALDGAMAGDRPLAVHDLAVPGCSALVDARLPPPGCVQPDAALSVRADLVVLAVGPAERQTLLDGGTRKIPITDTMNVDYRSVDRAFTELVGRLATSSGAVAIVDAGGATDPAVLDSLPSMIDEAAAATPNTTVVTDGQLSATTLAALVPAPQSASRTRVMVVGDSVSYGLAVQLDAVAPDRFSVVWAGGQNCPFVDVSELRWWPGAKWSMDECPNVDTRWPDTIASFRPDVVLVVSSLPEQAEQRYDDDPHWHVAGDPAYTAAHDAAMDRLVQLLAPIGGVVVVANAPSIVAGSFHGSKMARPARIDAWNAQIERWHELQPGQIGVLDLAARVTAAEQAAGTSLRTDGVHLTDEAMAAIIRDHLADDLAAAVASLRGQ
jgi:peptidoglycan/LPS O-acetylase OafA/YrhL